MFSNSRITKIEIKNDNAKRESVKMLRERKKWVEQTRTLNLGNVFY